jgi:hypothetical protein
MEPPTELCLPIHDVTHFFQPERAVTGDATS